MADENLPPLIALRALEASARHRSFARAASELGVSPSAITQHVRTIEEWVGTPLFRRTGREVTLSENLAFALPALSEGFERLYESVRQLGSSHRRDRVVSLSTTPSFAGKWLLPRLERFRALHPNVDVWLSSDMDLIDFSVSAVDLAIRYGAGGYDGLMTERLLAEAVLPVGAPALVAALGPFSAAADLLRAPLLHDANSEGDPTCPDWTMWLKARGVASSGADRGARYSQASHVIEEAVAGRGLALAKRALAANDIANGKLTPVLPDLTEVAFAYWIVWPRGRTLSTPMRLFIDWVRSEAVGGLSEGA